MHLTHPTATQKLAELVLVIRHDAKLEAGGVPDRSSPAAARWSRFHAGKSAQPVRSRTPANLGPRQTTQG
jgi:hypothetical protein